LTEREEKQP